MVSPYASAVWLLKDTFKFFQADKGNGINKRDTPLNAIAGQILTQLNGTPTVPILVQDGLSSRESFAVPLMHSPKNLESGDRAY
jgi:hypothetical protein